MKTATVDGKEVILFDSLRDVVETKNNTQDIDLKFALNNALESILNDEFFCQADDKKYVIDKVETPEEVVIECEGMRYSLLLNLDGDVDKYVRVGSEPTYELYRRHPCAQDKPGEYWYCADGIFWNMEEAVLAGEQPKQGA